MPFFLLSESVNQNRGTFVMVDNSCLLFSKSGRRKVYGKPEEK
jgi:hypothetical protein